MTILQQIDSNEWNGAGCDHTQQSAAIHALEQGKILLLPRLFFSLLPTETKLLHPRYAHPKAKNISFNRATDNLRCGQCTPQEAAELKNILARFSEAAEQLVKRLFIPYAQALQIGRTSLRVVEIAGRSSSYRKDDTRLHVDAFPATPNQGRRILRVFSNINPEGVDRVWRVGEAFEAVAKRFLPQVPKQIPGSAHLLKTLRITKSYRTEYDHTMLQIHDRMKADLHYQKIAAQNTIHFAPQTTWIVQTDHVSHAAMSGQHLLEQTFYLPITAMLAPALSPLRTLEKIAGRRLVAENVMYSFGG